MSKHKVYAAGKRIRAKRLPEALPSKLRLNLVGDKELVEGR
jgi:hypothetical protein